jgi:arabinogalactan oligomer/maltooligosaccharide transport system permease protein
MAVNVPASPLEQPRLEAASRRPRVTHRSAYFYLMPVAISALVFTLIPFFYTLYISFTNYSLYNFKEFGLVGWRNYANIFEAGSAFLPVLSWTVMWIGFGTIINVGGGMILALLLNHSGLRERNLYRTILIIPWAVPLILLAQVWAGIFNSQGPLNLLLGQIGINGVNWLNGVWSARAALLIMNFWFTYPFFMVVGLAALQAIPRDLYEVADLDGAGTWARLRDITFPFLLTSIMPLLITQVAFQFNNAGPILLLTGGNPVAEPGANYGSTDTLATYAYKLIYNLRIYGLAAAYSVVVFFIIAGLTVFNAKVTRSFEEAS